MFIYHISRRCDVGNLSLGYIGISKNPYKRILQHKMQSSNKGLSDLLNSGDFDLSIISEGSDCDMREMERWLRPSVNIGLNIATGGGLPPKQKKQLCSKICRMCFGEFYKIGRIRSKYCSSQCREKSKKERDIKNASFSTCKQCGDGFRHQPHSKKRYCSHDCYSKSLYGVSQSSEAREKRSVNSPKSRPVTIGGVEYRSVRHAARLLGIDCSTLRYRIKVGKVN